MNNLRFVVLFITALGSLVIYLTRTAITVALVSMVPVKSDSELLPVNDSFTNYTFISENNINRINCAPEAEDASVTQWLDELGSRRYDYSTMLQGFLKSIFFATYIILQVPAGSYAKKYGAKRFLVTSLAGSTVISLVTPFITDYTWLFLMSRALLGIFQSFWFPCSFVILMCWMPPSDQTFAVAAHTAGSAFGSIVTFFTSGYIVNHLNGWPSLFFIYGLSCLVVLIITTAFITSHPADHPLMTADELDLITNKSTKNSRELLPCTENNNELHRVSIISSKECDDNLQTDGTSTPPIPWFLIWTNKTFLSAIFYTFTNGCIFMILYTEIPEYLKTMLKEDSEHNGIVNGIIQLCYATTTLFIGFLSERIIERKILTRTSTRKMCAGICGYTSAACLIILPFISDLNAIHISLCLVGFFLGFLAGCQFPLPAEISINFGAQIYSLLNITSVITGLIVPNIISITLDIFPSDKPHLAWNFIFYSFAALNITSTTLFIVYVKAERQSFDYITNSRKNSRLSSVSL